MSTRCHVATRKGLFTLDRGASGWSVAPGGFRGRQLHAGDARCAQRGSDRGAQSRAFRHQDASSKDGGANWSEIATPQYPEKPADYTPKASPLEGKAADWSLKLVWALAPGGVDEPGVVWCGTLPGGLFRSEDGGDSWSLESPALGRPAARRMVRRRRGLSRDSLGLRRSARCAACNGRRLLRRRVDDARTAERRGSSGAAVCAPSSCRPSAHSSRTCRTRIWWRSVRQIRMRCGCSITTASSNRPMRPHPGPRLPM